MVVQPIVKHKWKELPMIDFKGLNKLDSAPDGFLTSSSRMSTRKLPMLAPDTSREELIDLLATGNALYTANGKKGYVDGVDFVYDNVKYINVVTSGPKNIVEFNGKILIFPDLKYYDYTTSLFGSINNTYTSGANQVSMINDTLNISDGSTATFAHNTITLTGTETWDEDSFAAGGTILIDGCVAYSENNKYATIISRTSTVLTFADNTFTAGTEAAAVSLTFSICKITTTGTGFTFFVVGDYIEVTGCTVKPTNNTYATITGVAEKVLSFDPSSFATGTETAAITVKVPIPAIIAATVWNNRVWGVTAGDDMYCTKLGVYNNWYQDSGPDGTYLYAWHSDTGKPGNFLGICTYQNHVYMFKNNLSIRIYDTNTGFQWVAFSEKGPVTNKGICEVNGMLFMAGADNDIYICSGGGWDSVGIPLNSSFTDAVAGTDGRCYYVSLKTSASAWEQFYYDTKCQIGPQWIQLDTNQVKDYMFMGGYLYALFANHKITKYNSGSEAVASSFILRINPVFYDAHRWYVGKIHVKLRIGTGASVEIQDRVDNGNYTSRKTFNTVGNQLCTFSLIQQRSGYYWLKFIGTGDYDIISIIPEAVRGSAK